MNKLKQIAVRGLLTLLAPVIFFACNKENVINNNELEEEQEQEEEVNGGPDFTFYALTDDNRLLELNAKDPGTAINSVPVTGLLSGEKALSIDFRPHTGQLYLLSSTSVIYTINPKTGEASIISTRQFDPLIHGNYASIDFDAVQDKIRMVSENGQNLRLDPETGEAVADGNIDGVNGASFAAIANTAFMPNVESTSLYAIDATTDKYYWITSPETGELSDGSDLGVDVTGTGAYDIGIYWDNEDGYYASAALAALTVGSENALYGIVTSSGALTKYGVFPDNAKVIGIAIPTQRIMYATDGNELYFIFPDDLSTTVSYGLGGVHPTNDGIVAIDMRPITGKIYALGNSGWLYSLNYTTYFFSMVGTGPISPLQGGAGVAGFDFDPATDRIRIVTMDGKNLSVNPNDGTYVIDSDLNPGSPKVTAAAYTNNFPGTIETTLYTIDAEAGMLYKQTDPSSGTLEPVGHLGISATNAIGFDIADASGDAYALLEVGGSVDIYTINLATGAATKKADFPIERARPYALALGMGL